LQQNEAIYANRARHHQILRAKHPKRRDRLRGAAQNPYSQRSITPKNPQKRAEFDHLPRVPIRMRGTLDCATASMATGHAGRRGRARQVGGPRRDWCAVAHRSDTISDRLERVRGLCARGTEGGDAEMCEGFKFRKFHLSNFACYRII